MSTLLDRFRQVLLEIFPDPLSYADAEATCAQFAPCDGVEIGSLSIVADRTAESFIKTVLGNLVAQPPAQDVWIGLNDITQEGMFTWSNGDPLVYKNFAVGQPDNGQASGVQSQNCVMYSPALNGWDDVQCQLTLPFFCMMPYETPQTAPQMPPTGPGGPGGTNPNFV
ncbi:putative C-type lectin domain family 19 member A [Apostichopus japonicus]|uniref:Putative C-type lectin domain family 19 member A n=1 Tax=Stichopus japonicus TaxID=307972 RepID=A0A2G8L563_STIJA|nr:putative C-type lectin domain family 19 member A [Apostichopus japonicus]